MNHSSACHEHQDGSYGRQTSCESDVEREVDGRRVARRNSQYDVPSDEQEEVAYAELALQLSVVEEEDCSQAERCAHHEDA